MIKKLAALVLLLIGAGLLVFDWFFYTSLREQEAAFLPVTGVVTDIEYVPVHDSRGRLKPDNYYPVVQFTTRNRQQYWHEPLNGSYKGAYRLGQKVKLYYNPANPNEAFIDEIDRWSAPVMLAFVAAPIAVLGGIGLVRL